MKFLITNNHLLRLILPSHAEGKMEVKNEVEIEKEVEDEVKLVISREVRGWEEVETEVEVKD